MDTIYTYGGGEILWKVFNGIAMLTKSDSPYFTSVIYVSALVGTILAVARALPGGQLGTLTKSWLIPTYIILSLLLVPKTAVHIIDEVDPTFRYERVDNIPVGIAFIASVSSSFARALTDEVEKLFAPDAKAKYGTSVPIFAAKLMSEARYVRISDPTIRKNIKDFARQCFRLPFVLTNIKGLRNEALHTNDILGFVERNAHSWLGIYWENPNGSIEFVSCREACPKVKAALEIEGTKGLSTLIARTFGKKDEADLGAMAGTLKIMAKDVWHDIAQQTSSASKALEQQLMVNAYREARDDKKAEFGMERISPELLSYSATRIIAQQNTGFLMKASIAGSYMPMLQSVAFAMLMIIGVIIIPLSLMPNGLSILTEWIKMVVSVQLWPLFSAIINGIAFMAQQKASASVLMGVQGFSIATQTGLADAAYDVACWMNALQLSLPFLSWAFVSRSGVAVSQLMSSFSGGLEGGAAKIGAETADGNISFDTQNFRNTSMGNVQYAQQQYAANINHGSSYDDGKISLTSSVYGQQTANVRQDALTTNMSSNDNITAQAAQNYSDAESLVRNHSRTLAENESERAASALSFTETAAKGQTQDWGLSKSEAADLRKSADDLRKNIAQYSENENLSAQVVTDMALKVNSGGSVVGKAAKLITGAEISGGLVSNAYSQEQLSKFKSSDEGKQISSGMSRLTSYASQLRTSETDSIGKQSAKALSSSHDKVKSGSEQLQHAYNKAENWSKIQSLAENKAFSSATNENAAWISYVAGKEGTDTASAIHSIEQGGANIERYRSEFTSAQTQALHNLVDKAGHILNEQEISDYMNKVNTSVGPESLGFVQKKVDQAEFKSSEELQGAQDNLRQQLQTYQSEADSDYKTKDKELEGQMTGSAKQYAQENGKLNAERMLAKVSRDTGDTIRGTAVRAGLVEE